MTVTNEARLLIEQIKAYSFPGGESAARRIRSIEQRSEGKSALLPMRDGVRLPPKKRWIARAARLSGCADGKRYLVRSGYRRVREWTRQAPPQERSSDAEGTHGPDLDKGELQRYLAYLSYCPSMIVNNTANSCLNPATRRNTVLIITDCRTVTPCSRSIGFCTIPKWCAEQSSRFPEAFTGFRGNAML